MNKSSRWARLAKLSGLLVLASSLVSNANVHPNASVAEKNPAAVLTKLPLTFEANAGQVDPSVKFIARAPGFTLFATPKEMVTVLSGTAPRTKRIVVRTQLKGADHFAPIRGENPQQAKSNYLVGNDPKKWVSGAEHFSRIRQSGVYPGVDLLYHGDNAELEYDFVVAPGADPKQICLSFIGADKIAIDANGDLKLITKQGGLTQHKPVVYQVVNGERLAVAGEYVRLGKREVGFKVAAYDHSKELVIDPVVEYATYFGGSGSDTGRAIAVDNAGNAYITGTTNSSDFPVLTPIKGTNTTNANLIFVSKINTTTNTLVYSTYLGGIASGNNDVTAIAIDSNGAAYLAGSTSASDFPIVNGFQTALASSSNADAYLAKLNPAGSALSFSSYLGGSLEDAAFGIALDTSGKAYVVGRTYSGDFPTRTPIQIANGGGSDAFITKIDTVAKSLVYSTYLGGNFDDAALGVAVDSTAHAHVVGPTTSVNFPTTPGAFQTSQVSFSDGYASKLSANGQALDYATRLSSASLVIGAKAVALNSSGNSVIAGFSSGGCPAGLSAIGTSAVTNGVLLSLDPTGSTMVGNACIGGGPLESLAIGANGDFFVSGISNTTIPVSGASTILPSDRFLLKLQAGTGALAYALSVGPQNNPFNANGLRTAVDAAGHAYMIGEAGFSSLIPVTPANQGSTLKGVEDAFLLKVGPSISTSVNLTTTAPANVPFKQAVDLTATVSGSATGNVTFKTSNLVLEAQPIVGTTALLSTTSLPPGVNNIVAVYDGDNTHDGSVSSPLQLTVAKARPAVHLDLSSTELNEGDTFTATVTISGGINLGGTVTIKLNGNELQTLSVFDNGLGSAKVSGVYQIRRTGNGDVVAVYSGDENNSGGDSNTIGITPDLGIFGGGGGCTISGSRLSDITLPMLLMLALWGLQRARRKVF